MSTTYNPNVPNPPDAPSVDVFPMHSNASGIGNWCGQYDHYGLNNVANTGLHKQITFAATNVPTAPTTPPILFTNTQDGAGNNLPNMIAQLFFYSGSAAQGKNNYVSTGAGSVLIFGGIILKWGTATPTSGTNFTVSYPVAFPTATFYANAIPSGNNRIMNVTNLTPSNFSMNANAAYSAGDLFYWFAIGN